MTFKLREIDLPKELSKIRKRGYIPSKRKGDTGVGYTIESLLKIPENNAGEPDCLYKGVPVEIKAKRASSRSMITLFTKEPVKSNIDDRGMIQTYGYTDHSGRQALKTTLSTQAFVPQGLKIKICTKGKIIISDLNDSDIWFWLLSDLKLKIQNLVLVFVSVRKSGGHEHFLVKEGHFLGRLDEECFLQLIAKGEIAIDLRMHIRSNGTVRNHGTAFRLRRFTDILRCYSTHEKLI